MQGIHLKGPKTIADVTSRGSQPKTGPSGHPSRDDRG